MVINNGDAGKSRRKTDKLLYRLIYIGIVAISGMVTGGVITFVSPTNAALNLEMEKQRGANKALETHIDAYIESHRIQEGLKDKIMENHLKEIKEDIKEIKEDVRKIKNGR